MDFRELLSTVLLLIIIGASFLGPPIIIFALIIYVSKGINIKSFGTSKYFSRLTSRKAPSAVWGSNRGNDEPDITSYSTEDIIKSGHFSASERQMEYRRRGQSPSGVIDGIYNDMNRENGRPYSDVDRDWDADA